MKITLKTRVIVPMMLTTFLWACNGQTRQHSTGQQSMNPGAPSELPEPVDSLDLQFREIRQAYMQDSSRMSPEARMTFHNMESMWTQRGQMQEGRRQNAGRESGQEQGMMRNRGMMDSGSRGRGMMDRGSRGGGMMGNGMSGMRHHMDQQLLSYSQGMHQMMNQSGNSRMATMYGQMAARMQQMMSNQPSDDGSSPSISETSGAILNANSLYISNCGGCHGSNGLGISGAFPPLNGSAVVQGDKETLTKILLHGLQGQLTVKGDTYNGIMPAFGNVLNDEQISAILTYVRSMSDNKSSSISTEEVHSIREKTASRQGTWTPHELELK